MGGLNLEVFKVSSPFAASAAALSGTNENLRSQFGTYVMFPIGIMFYFGTNLDNRFSVNGFWPRPEECNQLPRDREEVVAEYNRIVARQKLRQAILEQNPDAKAQDAQQSEREA
ncbi:hypothetical protein PT974_08551 [Cladobotryum mycophilum]|uniref:Mitochondrial cytochrome c oxidase assembly factor n=1 Tax=Cladobotryum mycophilum TaxID=491253 RepID=A0ABR0SDR0_9HYPO